MAAKVTLTITRGDRAGERFEFTEQARVLIGRQEDCAIVVPEKTVSRYHCLLEILPPKVRLQDFGSLNGTYLNGSMIGQRDREQTWEEARDQDHTVHDLQDGDVLALGKQCEIRCAIEEEKPAADPMATLLMSQAVAAEQKKDQRKCAGCGKLFTPAAPDNNLCGSCLADRAKMLSGVLDMLNIHAKQAQDKALNGEKGQQAQAGVPKPAGKAGQSPAKVQKPAEKAMGPALLSGFEKIALLGKGGMGEVWKVREKKTGREYALKTMLPDVAMDEQAKRLFLREADICTCLRHPNVVRGYQTGCANGVLYILMDLCEGGSADDLIKRKGGKLSLELATWIMLQVLSGLDYVHNMDVNVEIKAGRFKGMKEVSMNGVVHRDFKPGNIFLSDRSDHPVAMVADFGMAKAFAAAGKSQVSRSGAVMGTPVFMPRQQAQNCKYAKPEVDIWAAAASYYYMLTGTFPKRFRPGVNVFQVLIMESAVPIRERNPEIPAGLAAVIDRALTEKPSLPYTSAAALRKDLADALPEKVKAYCRGILK